MLQNWPEKLGDERKLPKGSSACFRIKPVEVGNGRGSRRCTGGWDCAEIQGFIKETPP